MKVFDDLKIGTLSSPHLRAYFEIHMGEHTIFSGLRASFSLHVCMRISLAHKH